MGILLKQRGIKQEKEIVKRKIIMEQKSSPLFCRNCKHWVHYPTDSSEELYFCDFLNTDSPEERKAFCNGKNKNKEIDEIEKYIYNNTKVHSNKVNNNYSELYQPWLTPDEARNVAKCARKDALENPTGGELLYVLTKNNKLGYQRAINDAEDWFKAFFENYNQQNSSVNCEDILNKFKQYMEKRK
jgi:hypothetical protein